MLQSIKSIWITFLVYYIIYVLSVNDNFVACRNTDATEFQVEMEYEMIKNVSGFNLDEEDMSKFHIWPSGIIPYYIDDFSFDKVLRDRLRSYLDGVNTLTGLRFLEIPRPPVDDSSRWVLILNRRALLGCADHPFENFTTNGVQRVVLGYNCLNSDENLADIVLSLVGVPPQHNSPDRDKFITVVTENIIPDKLYLFEKLKENEWLFYDLPHDYQSAGHFPYYRHTLNGKVTLLPKRKLQTLKYQDKTKGFSYKDILKIKMLYSYISRQRENSLTMSECSKLFEPSSKLSSSHVLHSKGNIKSRPKPNRYLGKSEKVEYSDEEKHSSGENKNITSDRYEKNNDEENNNREDDNKHSPTFETKLDHIESENENKEEGNYEYTTVKNQVKLHKEMVEEKDSESHEINNTYDITTATASVKKETVKLQYLDTTRKKHHLLPLVHSLLHSKKLKLLGQSDYETGDEGNKKYVHEKGI